MSNGRIKVRPYEYDRLALKVAKYRRDDLKRMVNLVAVHVKKKDVLLRRRTSGFLDVSVLN